MFVLESSVHLRFSISPANSRISTHNSPSVFLYWTIYTHILHWIAFPYVEYCVANHAISLPRVFGIVKKNGTANGKNLRTDYSVAFKENCFPLRYCLHSQIHVTRKFSSRWWFSWCCRHWRQAANGSCVVCATKAATTAKTVALSYLYQSSPSNL